jgi:hypothetical protein
MRSEMHPNRTVRVGRNEDFTDADSFDPIRVTDYYKAGRAEGNPQNFDGKGRRQHTVDRREQGNPAYDSTARIHAQQAMTGCGGIQLLQAAQCPGETA